MYLEFSSRQAKHMGKGPRPNSLQILQHLQSEYMSANAKVASRGLREGKEINGRQHGWTNRRLAAEWGDRQASSSQGKREPIWLARVDGKSGVAKDSLRGEAHIGPRGRYGLALDCLVVCSLLRLENEEV